MSSEFEKIERFQALHSARLLAIEGVVSVTMSIGQGGAPCLKIGTSLPVEQVRGQLPPELDEVAFVVEFQGDLAARIPASGGSDEASPSLAIERFHSDHAAELLRIDGVVAVSPMVRADGTPYLEIGTSLPVDEVRPRLPAVLADVEHELKYVGEIRIQ